MAYRQRPLFRTNAQPDPVKSQVFQAQPGLSELARVVLECWLKGLKQSTG